jgi:hypothetical protein
MRPPHLPLPQRIPSLRPSPERRPAAADKAPNEAKPPKKRSLNEAAHKLGY